MGWKEMFEKLPMSVFAFIIIVWFLGLLTYLIVNHPDNDMTIGGFGALMTVGFGGVMTFFFKERT